MRTETEWKRTIRILFHIRNRHDSSQYSLRNFTVGDNVQQDGTRTNRSSHFLATKAFSEFFAMHIYLVFSPERYLCFFLSFWIYIHMMTTSTHAQRSQHTQLLPYPHPHACRQLDTRHVWGLETKALATHTPEKNIKRINERGKESHAIMWVPNVANC